MLRCGVPPGGRATHTPEAIKPNRSESVVPSTLNLKGLPCLENFTSA
jgi:hypothetical protein